MDTPNHSFPQLLAMTFPEVRDKRIKQDNGCNCRQCRKQRSRKIRKSKTI